METFIFLSVCVLIALIVKSKGSADLKKALATVVIVFGFVLYIPFAWQSYWAGVANEKETARAAYKALTPEQQVRKKIDGITEYIAGVTVTDEEALNLTINHYLIGFFDTEKEIYHKAASDFKIIYKAHPKVETVEIQYNLKVANAYGEISYKPAIRITLDATTYKRIQWQNFDTDNLDKLAQMTPLIVF